jgi:fumarylacetoacetase
MATLDETHDRNLVSWVASARGHADFPIQNLPFGVFSCNETGPRIGVAIGDDILDLRAVVETRDLLQASTGVLTQPALNALFALPARARRLLRTEISRLLADPAMQPQLIPLLRPAASCTMHLPAHIGDYTDFYVGIHHARTVGSIFRPDMPLQPNYKFLPIGYHGRASSVRPTGTPVLRPQGQTLRPPATEPTYGPSRQLDYELELGIWVGEGNPLGRTVPMHRAAEQIVGLCLLNDWSARDIQNWERLPLGPFLSKSFLTSVSPWVITSEALAPFRMAPHPRPAGDPAPLPYLTDAGDLLQGQYALELEVRLLTAQMRREGQKAALLSNACARDMYWTFAQIVTHHASNGCNLSPGDLLGTGTISGPTRGGAGSLFEHSQAGKQPLELPNGERRGFLEDGDEVIFSARARAPGAASIGFGECRGTILAADAEAGA